MVFHDPEKGAADFECEQAHFPNFVPTRNVTSAVNEKCRIEFQVGEKASGLRNRLIIIVSRKLPGGKEDDEYKGLTMPGYTPLDFSSRDDFQLDLWTGKIYRRGGQVSLEYVLNRLYAAHVRRCRKIVGVWLRFRIRALDLLPDLMTRYYVPSMLWCMRFISGKQIDGEFDRDVVWMAEEVEYARIVHVGNPMKTPVGFECSKSTGLLSLILTVSFALVLYWKSNVPIQLQVFFDSMFLVGVLLVFDFLIPNLLLWGLNRVIRRTRRGPRTSFRI